MFYGIEKDDQISLIAYICTHSTIIASVKCVATLGGDEED